MKVLIKDSFKTNLGEIELTVTSESEFQYVISDNLKAENEFSLKKNLTTQKI